MDGEWVVTAFPGAEGVGSTIQLFVPSQAILTSSPEQEVATWLFVKYLAGNEAQLAWSGADRLLQHPQRHRGHSR